MFVWTRRVLLALLAAAGGAGPAAAQTVYSWTQPATGTTGNWSTGPWTPGTPVSGAATALLFNTLQGNTNSFTFTNDLGAFTANGLTASQFGTGTLTLALGASPFTLDGTNPFLNVAGPGNTTISAAGGLVLNAQTTVGGGGNGQFTLNPVIGGNFGLTFGRTGNGITTLGGVNTFTGPVNVNSGVVAVAADTAFGNTANNLTFGGGVLRPTSALTTARGLTVGAGGATIAGTSSTTANGALSGSGPLLTLESGTFTLNANNAGYTGAVTLGAQGPTVVGNLLATANTGGITLATSGTLANASGLTVQSGGVLAVTRGTSTLTASQRLGTVPVTLNGGTFTYSPGAGAADANNNLGSLTISGGLGVVRTAGVAGDSGGTDLTFSSLARANRAVLALGANTTGTGQIGLGASVNSLNVRVTGLADSGGSGTSRGVVPWAHVLSGTAGIYANNLVTYDGATGFRPLTAGEVATGLTASANSNLTATTNALTANLSVQSIQATSAVGVATVSGAFTLTVTSGAVQHYNGLTFTDTTLAFPTGVTGYIHQGDTITFGGAGNITGDSGVVFSSFSSYRANFNAANGFTGGLTFNGRYTGAAAVTAGANFTADNQLGAAGQPITLSGGQLSYTNTTADGTLGARPITLAGPGVLTVGTGRTLTVPGTVSGPGSLSTSGAGTVNLTNAAANTFTGGTQVTAGVLQASAANQLGTGPLFLSGGTLRAAGPLAFGPAGTPSGVTVTTASTLDLQANATTLGVPLASTAAVTLTKTGTGLLTLTGDGSRFGGPLTVAAGGLTLGGTSPTGGGLPQLTVLTVTGGSTVTLDNNGAYNPNRFADNGRLAFTGPGAFVSYVPPTTAVSGVAERFGTLDAAAAGGVFSVTGNATGVTLSFANLVNSAGLTIRGDSLGNYPTGPYTRVLFDSLNGAPITGNLAVIPNVFFATGAGTGTSTTAAGYDFTTGRGLIVFTPTPVSGNTINNASPTSTPLTADFTTNANTTAVTGASIYKLTLDGGSTLTLNGGNAASTTNGNTPDGTLAISGGQLVSQNGAKLITSGAARTVSFGSAAAQVSVATGGDLTLDPNVALAGTAGLTKLGTGTLAVNGPYGVTGPTTVSAGTLLFGQSATVQDLTGPGTVSIGANTLTVNSANASTFSGTLVGTGSLVKAGTATFTFSPANAPALSGGVTVAQGTLLLGNNNAATGVLGGALTLGSAAGNTGGIVDLNGFSPSGALTSITTAGTSTANAIVNSNASAASTLSLNLPANTTLPLSFGGNLVINKQDATTLTLAGTAATPATTTGVINVQAGTLVAPGSSNFGGGFSFNVSPGATLSYGSFGNNNTDAGAYGTITATGSTVKVTGGSGDLAANKLVFTGGTLDFTGSATFYLHMRNAGASIVTNASSTPTTFIQGTSTSARIQNDAGAPVPVVVAAGTTPSGVDLAGGILFSSGTAGGTFSKQGAGVLELSFQGTNTATFQVAAGTLQVATGSTLASATVTGGVLRGTGTVGGATVNGGFVQGGSLANPVGTLTSTANITIGAGGGLQAVVGASAASAISLTGSTTVLNLNPGAGNQFVLNLVNNPNDPVVSVPPTQYSYTLATVATAGNLKFNGTTLNAGDTVPASSYTVTGFTLAPGYSLNVDGLGTGLVFTFTPVPEPATVLAVAAAGLGLARLRRRRATA